MGRWGFVSQGAVERAPEQILALLTVVEQGAVAAEAGLPVSGTHAVEDIPCPALEVGKHDVRPGRPGIDVGTGGKANLRRRPYRSDAIFGDSARP